MGASSGIRVAAIGLHSPGRQLFPLSRSQRLRVEAVSWRSTLNGGVEGGGSFLLWIPITEFELPYLCSAHTTHHMGRK